MSEVLILVSVPPVIVPAETTVVPLASVGLVPYSSDAVVVE